MGERLSWQEIQKEYPDQWVGLIDVARKGATIISAVVKYTGMTHGELSYRQLSEEGLCGVYTSPDHLAPLGIVGFMA